MSLTEIRNNGIEADFMGWLWFPGFYSLNTNSHLFLSQKDMPENYNKKKTLSSGLL